MQALQAGRSSILSANELLARDTNNDSTNDFTLAYDLAGFIKDDGEDYEYQRDAFGRIVEVRTTSSQALVAEYRYTGLNELREMHWDINTSGTVDGSDPWIRYIYDDQWRRVAVFRDADLDSRVRGNDGA